MFECLETNPAYMDVAPRTRHVVAAFGFLDVGLALWARLDVVLRLPFGEQALVLVLRFDFLRALARALVFLAETVRADTDQTRRALYDFGVTMAQAVDLRAVGCKTVAELRLVAINVVKEGGLAELLEVGNREQVPRDEQRDGLRAACSIAEACQGEDSMFACGT